LSTGSTGDGSVESNKAVHTGDVSVESTKAAHTGDVSVESTKAIHGSQSAILSIILVVVLLIISSIVILFCLIYRRKKKGIRLNSSRNIAKLNDVQLVSEQESAADVRELGWNASRSTGNLDSQNSMPVLSGNLQEYKLNMSQLDQRFTPRSTQVSPSSPKFDARRSVDFSIYSEDDAS
jgi:cbb3-type cytochrome oxidase subunit 3